MSNDSYAPKPLALAACALFFIPSLGHTYLIFAKKAHYMWPFLIGCYGEAFGYLTRYLDAKHPDPNGTSATAIATLLLIVLAPAFMAASHYMIFGRISRQAQVGHLVFIPFKAFTAVFVGFDVLSILLQAAGGSMSTSTSSSTINIADIILKVGYMIQVVGVGFFLILAYITKRRALAAGVLYARWTKMLRLLFTGSIIIVIRAFYRFLEISITHQSSPGTVYPLTEHEWTFYIFDTLLMLPVPWLFLIFHPSRYLSSTSGNIEIPGSKTSSQTNLEMEQQFV